MSTDTTDIAELLERTRYRGPRVGWDDVVGHEEAKTELRMVAEQYRRGGVAERLGLTLVKGILLIGPPGTGKSLLARALASVIDRPVHVIPSTEVDPADIRRIYETLSGVPSVVVWDEADVLLRSRSRVGATERRTVAAWCSAVDGVDPMSGPISVCLTADGAWSLDGSALRSGRLTTKCLIELPDRPARLELWRRQVKGLPIAGTLDLERAADQSIGCSGADIESMVQVALGLGLVAGVEALTQGCLDQAIQRRGHVVEGPRPSPEELEIRAVHEAGHGLYAALTWGEDAVASITIQASSIADGRTTLTEAMRADAPLTLTRMREMVRFAYAGMAAELLVLGPERISAGSGDDIARATRLLKRLVGDLGANADIGPVSVSILEQGHESDRGPESLRRIVFEAVRSEAITALEVVRSELSPHGEGIRRLADALIRAEGLILSGSELSAALRDAVSHRGLLATGNADQRPHES